MRPADQQRDRAVAREPEQLGDQHRVMAKPEEIAAFALTLASEEFPYMTGTQMVIDGGKTSHA